MTGRKGRSGGARVGTQGEAYAQRSDLNSQPVRAAPSQTYGDRAAQERSQEAVPVAGPVPVSLNAPSTRPDEHPMTGVPMGPGPGPEILPTPPPNPMAQLTPRDRLQIMLQSALQAGENADDLAELVNRLSRRA